MRWLLGMSALLFLLPSATAQNWNSNNHKVLDFYGRFLTYSRTPKLSPSTELTLEAWVWPINQDNGGEYYALISCLQDNGNIEGGGYALWMQNNRIRFQVMGNEGAGKGVDISSDGNTFRRDYWNHVMATYNASTGQATIYINGERKASGNMTSSNKNIVYSRNGVNNGEFWSNDCNYRARPDVSIGRYEDEQLDEDCSNKRGRDTRFRGYMDQVRIWSEAKSQDYAKYIWNGGAPNGNNIIGIEDNLELYVMIDPATQKPRDYSLNKYNDKQSNSETANARDISNFPRPYNATNYFCPPNGFANPQAPTLNIENTGCQQLRLSWDPNDFQVNGQPNNPWSRVRNEDKEWVLMRVDDNSSLNGQCVENGLSGKGILSAYNRFTSSDIPANASNSGLKEGYWVFPWSQTSVDLRSFVLPGKNDHRFILRARYRPIGTLSKASSKLVSTYRPPIPEITSIKAIKAGEKTYNEVTWKDDKAWVDSKSSTLSLPQHKYLIYRGEPNGALTEVGSASSNTPFRVEVSDSDAGKVYHYQVVSSYDKCSLYPAGSTQAGSGIAFQNPERITGSPVLSVTSQQGETPKVGWTFNSSSVNGYRVEVDGKEVASLNSGISSYSLAEASECKTVKIKVFAFNIWGEVSSNEVDVEIAPAGMPAIQGFKASDGAFESRIVLNWQKVDKAVGYRIFRDNEQITSISDAGTLTYTDRDVNPGTLYTYRLEAFDDCSVTPHVTASDVGFILPNGRITGNISTPNGQVVEGVEVRATPILGGAYRFTGNNTSIQVQGIELDILRNFTLEEWISPETEGNFVAFDLYDANRETAISVVAKKGAQANIDLEVILKNGNGGTVTVSRSSNVTFMEKRWYHVALLKKDASLYLALNGKTLGEPINASDFNNYKQKVLRSFSPGGVLGGTNNNGRIDEVRVWRQADHLPLLKRDYRRTLAGTEQGLYLYYRFDEGNLIQQQGRVYNLAQATIESGLNGAIQNGVLENINCDSLYTSGFSDAQGNYLIRNVNYGSVDGQTFKVTPVLNARTFSPESRNITLNPSRAVVDQVDFEDTSTMPVSGVISYQKLNAAYYQNNPAVCYVSAAEVLVDGKTTSPPTITDLNGRFTTDVTLGKHTFTVKPMVRTVVDSVGGVKQVVQLNNGAKATFASAALYERGTTTQVYFKIQNDSLKNGQSLPILVFEKQDNSPAMSINLQTENSASNTKHSLAIGSNIISNDFQYGQWHLLSMDWNSQGELKVYVHRYNQSSKQWQATQDAATLNPESIAQAKDAVLQNTLAGQGKLQIAALRKWNQPLSSAVIAANANKAADGENRLTSYWNLQEGSGTLLLDGRRRVNGTLSGNAQWIADNTMPLSLPKTSVERQFVQKFAVAQAVAPRFQSAVQGDTAYSLLVTAPTTEVNFENVTGFSLTVNISGRCNFSIGNSLIKLRSTTGCFEYRKENAGQTTVFENLPPLNYTVEVIPTQTPGISFDAQEVNLDSDKQLDFLYRAPLQIDILPIVGEELIGEKVENCTGARDYVVMKQNGFQGKPHQYPVRIQVYEDYLGKHCFVDNAQVNIADGIGDIANPDNNISFAGPEPDKAIYTIRPGTPNFADGGARPFQKQFTVQAEDESNRTAIKTLWAFVEGQGSLENNFTTGIVDIPLYVLRDPPGDQSYSYIEEGEEICASAAYDQRFALNLEGEGGIDVGPNISFTVPFVGITTNTDTDNEAKVVISSSTGGGTAEETEFCVSIGQTIQTPEEPELIGEDGDVFFGVGVNYIFGEVQTLTFDCNKVEPKRMLAAQIDSVNTVYAYPRAHIKEKVIPNLRQVINSRIAQSNTTTDPAEKAKLIAEVNRMRLQEANWEKRLRDSKYQNQGKLHDLDQYNIKNRQTEAQIDTLLNNLNNGPGNNNDAEEISNSVDQINELIETINKRYSQSPKFSYLQKNISFAHGAPYEYGYSYEGTNTNTGIFALEIEAGLKNEFKVEVNGVGVESEKQITVGFEFEYTWSDSYGTSTTTGFFLHDDDPGDHFTVDVQKDEDTGIVHFVTKGGESMYPHEEGTRQRQKPVIDPVLVLVNQDPNAPATGTLKLANQSETDDPSEWLVHIPSHRNPKGLKVFMNGANITDQPVQVHGLPAGQQLDLLIEAHRNPLYYEYDSVMLTVYTTDDVPEMNRVSDTAYLTIRFSEPCVESFEVMRVGDTQILPSTDLSAFRWLINKNSEATVTENGREVKKARLPVIFRTANWEAVRNNANGVETFALEYSPAGEERWLKASETEQLRSNLQANNASEVTMLWDATNLADGEYRFRIKATCKNGTSSYSPQVSGIISRIAAGPLEVYPQDGIASKNDQIGVRYTKDIVCDIKPFNWSIWGVYNGVRYTPYSLKLNGFNTSARLATGDNQNINGLFQGSQSFTMEFWLRAGAAKEGVVLSNLKQEGAKYKGFRVVQRTDGKLVVEVANADGTLSKLVTNTSVNDGKWHHIALQIRRAEQDVNLRGVNVLMDLRNIGQLNFRIDQAVLASEAPLLLGVQGFGGGLHYDGWIDEVRIWDNFRKVAGTNSLTSEWKRHINSAIGLAGYWKLDPPTGGANDRVIDLIQQDNLGPIAGGFQWDSEQRPDWNYRDLTYSAAVPATVSCDERNLFFQLPQDINTRKALENVLLKAYVKGLRDQFGNRTDSVGWEFLVDQNSLRWDAPNIDIDKVEGEEKTFTMRLRNAAGNKEESFKLESLPSWLTAEPLEGKLLPGGFIDIKFTLANWMVSDKYSTEVFAETEEGWEPLLINARVLCEAPKYTFNATDYDQRMALVAELEFEGVKSTDKHDRVYAFIGNELRGMAAIEATQDGKHVAYLDVYGLGGDQSTNITLHLWDASHCREYAGVSQTYPFVGGGLEGGTTPELWKPTGNRVQTIKTTSGWNWISWQVAALDNSTSLNQMKATFDNGDVIKDQGRFATYQLVGNSWNGSLSNIDPKSGYLLKMQYNGEYIRLTGTQVPAATPIALTSGWNQIGYLPEAASRIDEALNSIKPTLTDSDLILGPNGFAYFNPNTGWVGSLKFLEPGTAYKIKLANGATLTYPDIKRQSNGRSSHRSVPITELMAEEQNQIKLYELSQQAGWNFAPRRFEKSLSMVVAIPESIQGENLLIGAFQGENCQGIALQSIAEGQRRFFLPVGLNNGEEVLQFKLFNPETGEQHWAANVEGFAENSLVGKVEAPYTLEFLEGGDRRPFLSKINGQEQPEGAVFEQANLIDILTNFDQDEIDFKVEGQNELLVSIENGMLSVTSPHENWNGSETLTIMAVDQTENTLMSNSIEVSYTLLPVDDRPEWIGLEALSGVEDGYSLAVDLSSYVDEVDGDEVVYAIVAPDGWDATLEGSQLTASPSENWNGLATFTLTATDQNTEAQLQSETDLVIAIQAVDDEPILHPIPNQAIQVGEQFEAIALADFLEELDGDKVQWEFASEGDQTQMQVSMADGMATIQPIDPNWVGEVRLRVTAVDQTTARKSAAQTVTLQVMTYLDILPQGNSVQLLQNSPNPFVSSTALLYHLTEDSQTNLIIYDMSGRKVKDLIHRLQQAGTYMVEWNGTDNADNIVPSGIYLGILQLGDQIMQIKLIKQ